MMQVSFDGVSKRFGQTRIITDFSRTFSSGKAYHIAGGNGSGKSSFLKIVCGYTTPDKGKITYTINEKNVEVDDISSYVSFCAPYIDLLDEFTGREQIEFHASFKPMISGTNVMEELKTACIHHALDKPLRLYSSGMKQRLKLILTFLSDSPLLLLDEPCSNLDSSGRNYYASLAERYIKNRLVLVASNNITEEHFFCTERIDISQ